MFSIAINYKFMIDMRKKSTIIINFGLKKCCNFLYLFLYLSDRLIISLLRLL